MIHRRWFSMLVAGAVVLGVTAIGGSAGPAQKPLTGQEIAQKILSVKGLQLTANARAALDMVARGDRQFSNDVKSTDQAATGATKESTEGKQEGGDGLRNVRVNDPSEDRHQTDQTTQSETSVAVQGKNVVVGFNDSQTTLLFLTAGSNLSGYAYSKNVGDSFTDGGAIPNRPGELNLGDPWLSTDRTGAIYYSTLVINFDPFTGFNFDVGVAKSTDGGKTFGAPVRVDTQPEAAANYSADKDQMTSGRDPKVASRDDLYDGWDDFVVPSGPTFSVLSGLPVSHSSDGGATWQVSYADQITLVSPNPSDCSFHQYIGAFLIVDPHNGAVYDAAERIDQDNPTCMFNPPPPTTFSHWIFKSFDGGNTWPQRAKISDVTSASPTGLFKLGPHEYMRDLEFPSLAFDAAGNLNDAWNDGTSGHSHVRLATSTDGGLTWPNNRFVTSGSNDEIQPEMSGDASGLHILYYSRNPDNTLDVKAANSADGATWSSRRVTSQSFPGVFTFPQFDPIIAFAYMGDYIANVSDGTNQFFAWGDNRDVVTNFLWPQGRNDPDVFYATTAK